MTEVTFNVTDGGGLDGMYFLGGSNGEATRGDFLGDDAVDTLGVVSALFMLNRGEIAGEFTVDDA